MICLRVQKGTGAGTFFFFFVVVVDKDRSWDFGGSIYMSQKAERQGEEELKDRQRQLQIGGRGSVVLSRRENMDLTNFIGPCRYTESAQARGHEGRDECLGYRPIILTLE
jgi:hypothetical protein